jgi:hypothetical protein
MLGKIGFWIARPILDAACQQHFVEPLRTRKAVTDVATPGKRLKLQIDLRKETGQAPIAPARFYSFTDPEANTREQIQKARSHPWISQEVPIRGFVYDVSTGRLSEVFPDGETATSYSNESRRSMKQMSWPGPPSRRHTGWLSAVWGACPAGASGGVQHSPCRRPRSGPPRGSRRRSNAYSC